MSRRTSRLLPPHRFGIRCRSTATTRTQAPGMLGLIGSLEGVGNRLRTRGYVGPLVVDGLLRTVFTGSITMDIDSERDENHHEPGALARSVSGSCRFKKALIEFLKLHVVNDSFDMGLMPAIFRRTRPSPRRSHALHSVVAQAAGRAGAASELTNLRVAVQGIRRPLDPVAAWATMIRPKPLLEPEGVLSACDQALRRSRWRMTALG